jgi:hypothetical protein
MPERLVKKQSNEFFIRCRIKGVCISIGKNGLIVGSGSDRLSIIVGSIFRSQEAPGSDSHSGNNSHWFVFLHELRFVYKSKSCGNLASAT